MLPCDRATRDRQGSDSEHLQIELNLVDFRKQAD